MAYKKIGNNKYRITIELGYDILGKRRRYTETFHGNATEVKKRDAELTKEYYHTEKAITPKELTWEKYSAFFVDKYCKENVSRITLEHYQFLLKRINSLIGHFTLNKITTFILDNMYEKLKYANKDKPLSNESILHYYRLINVMFNQAIKWDFVKTNPNLKAQKPKKATKTIKFYDEPQVDNLLECLENESIKYKAIITLTIDTGARRGEIVALRWGDINFETNEVLLDNSLKVINGEVDEEKAKTDSSVRKVFITNTTKSILQEYKIWQEEHIKKLGKKWIGSDRVFTAYNGKYMYPSTPYKIIVKVMKKYGLSSINFHGLRHTCATLLLDKGVNPKAVSERLGHSTTSITMNIYAHTTTNAKKESANIMEDVLKNACN